MSVQNNNNKKTFSQIQIQNTIGNFSVVMEQGTCSERGFFMVVSGFEPRN